MGCDRSWVIVLPWRSIVPAVQPRGGDPAEVQQAQRPHETDGAERDLPLPLAGRRGPPRAGRGERGPWRSSSVPSTKEPTRSTRRGLSKRTSKRPPTTAGAARASAIAD